MHHHGVRYHEYADDIQLYIGILGYAELLLDEMKQAKDELR